jgi:hypothetical protein
LKTAVELDDSRARLSRRRTNKDSASISKVMSVLRLDDAQCAPCLSQGQRQHRQHGPTHIDQVANDKAKAVLRRPALLRIEQPKGDAKDEEVGKERVEVAFEGEVEDLGEVGVVEVGEDAEELGV